MTNYKIFGELPNRVTVYHNIWYTTDGNFYSSIPIEEDAQVHLAAHFMSNKLNVLKPWKPTFSSVQDLEHNKFKTISDICFMQCRSVCGSPAHCMGDDCIPEYIAVCTAGYNPSNICTIYIDVPSTLSNNDFCFDIHDDGDYDIRSYYTLLFGHKAKSLKQYEYTLFETLIVGGVGMGVHNYDSNYTSPGRLYRRAFRDYVYSQIGVKGQLQDILFIQSDRRQILNYDLTIKELSKDKSIVPCNWSCVGSFADQIKTLAQTKIYITSDGSNAHNSMFLPDGAVVILLGEQRSYGSSYLSDFLYPALDFIRVVYHNNKRGLCCDNNCFLIIDIPELKESLKKAELLIGSFPVEPEKNISPQALVILPYLRDNYQTWLDMRKGNVANAGRYLYEELTCLQG